jgi:protein gp37
VSDNTGIEWTDATWNPVTGCDEVSPGCDHCYAKTFAERWRGTPGHYFENGFDVQLRPDKLTLPLSWRKPRKVFVNSMSDLFHDAVPDEYIGAVFKVMQETPQHTYQILTKRHGRMRSLLTRWAASGELPVTHEYEDDLFTTVTYEEFPWPLPNVWLGVSVEDQKRADIRIPALLETPAAVRWLSCEPLLGPLDLTKWTDTPPICGCGVPPEGAPGWPGGCCAECMVPQPCGIDWVVVGGESGAGARPMHPDWARALRDQCSSAGVPFHFKQWGQWTWHPQPETPGGFVGPQAEWSRSLPRTARPDRWYPMWRVGKGRAGRSLDGRTWDEYPVSVGEVR